MFCIFRLYEQQALPHKDTIFVSLHTGLLEKWRFQIISIKKLQLQSMTAESLSVARAQRVHWNSVGTFFNMLENVAT